MISATPDRFAPGRHATPEFLGQTMLFGGIMGIFGAFPSAVRAARTAHVEAMKG